MKNRITNFLAAACAVVFLCASDAFAQSDWLDMRPLPNWNSRSRAILQTKKIPPDVMVKCGKLTRPATLPADRLLARQNWTLIGPAQVYGRTTVVTVAGNFDGMCRPLEFQTLVFVGDRVAGTMSPGPMNSRTDGALTNVRLLSANSLTAEYVRYKDSDPLCCPSKVEAASWNIKSDGANFLLTPEMKTDTRANAESRSPADAVDLRNTVWRWQRSETPTGKTAVDKPENYQLEFTSDGRVRVRADCNRGTGGYQAEGGNLKFTPIALTRAMCPPGSLDSEFLRGLEGMRPYSVEGDTLTISRAGDGGTMYFSKVPRQN